MEERLAAIGDREQLNAEELALELVVNRRPARWVDGLALLVVKVAS